MSRQRSLLALSHSNLNFKIACSDANLFYKCAVNVYLLQLLMVNTKICKYVDKSGLGNCKTGIFTSWNLLFIRASD